MPHAAHHALLDRPGIRADLQHVEVVIGFKQQQIGAPQMKLDGLGDVAQIGRHADTHALGFKAEADRIDGIVRDAETFHLDIANLKAGARLIRFEARLSFAPIDGRRREPCHVNGGANFFVARQHGQAGHMIGMFVSDEDGIDAGEVFTDGR